MPDTDAADVPEASTSTSPPDPREFVVVIDGHAYAVTERALAGADLRCLPQPPIPPDRDLYLEVLSHHDRLVSDDDLVDLSANVHLFSAPRAITAG